MHFGRHISHQARRVRVCAVVQQAERDSPLDRLGHERADIRIRADNRIDVVVSHADAGAKEPCGPAACCEPAPVPLVSVFRDVVFHDLNTVFHDLDVVFHDPGVGHALANHVRRLAPPEKAASNRGLNLISFLGS